MNRRILTSLLVALAVAGSLHASAAAKSKSPRYLVCDIEAFGELYIVVENFGGVSGAVKHCVDFWKGHPRGFVD